MSGQRLRLTTSRPAGYRRGGQVIGNAGSPTLVERDGITAGQLLAVCLDPNIAMAFESSDDRFETVDAEAREFLIGQLKEVIALDGPDRTFGPALDPMADQERAEIEARARAAVDGSASAAPETGSEPDTAEPQGGEVAASAKASDGNGADAAPTDSTASAGGAVTPEPTAQDNPAAPEPAAKPKPASKGGGKAKGTAA